MPSVAKYSVNLHYPTLLHYTYFISIQWRLSVVRMGYSDGIRKTRAWPSEKEISSSGGNRERMRTSAGWESEWARHEKNEGKSASAGESKNERLRRERVTRYQNTYPHLLVFSRLPARTSEERPGFRCVNQPFSRADDDQIAQFFLSFFLSFFLYLFLSFVLSFLLSLFPFPFPFSQILLRNSHINWSDLLVV